MRRIIVMVVLALVAPFALAHDLSEFPKPFAEEGEVNALIVVGSGAPASHVIAQTNIALMFSQEAGIQALGISMLDSDVDTINQNTISIGNPCDNEVSALILGNPSDCDAGYAQGEASIRIVEQGGYTHIIAAGATHEGTLAAAKALRNYDSLDFEGDSYEMAVDEPREAKGEAKTDAAINAGNLEEEIETDAEITITDDNPKVGIDGIVQEESPEEETVIEQSALVTLSENQPNIFIRFFAWVGNLFG